MTTDETVRHALNEAAWALSAMVRGHKPDARAVDHAYRLCEAALEALRHSGNS